MIKIDMVRHLTEFTSHIEIWILIYISILRKTRISLEKLTKENMDIKIIQNKNKILRIS